MNKKYEKLEDMAKDLYDVFNERSCNKYSKMLAMVADIKNETEKLLLDAKTEFEQASLKSIIADCEAIKETLSGHNKKRAQRALEIYVEDILIEAKTLRGKLDPGYDPTENFVPDIPEYENPLLDEACEFYISEYGDY